MKIRRNVAAIGQAERARYVQGVLALRNTPHPSGSGNYYDWYIKTYHTFGIPMYGKPGFLPWFREFIRRFEADMAVALNDPGYALPYWEYQSNEDVIWSSNFMGGDGTPTLSDIVLSGPFAAPGWSPWPGDFVRRSFGPSAGVAGLPDASDVIELLSSGHVYDTAPWNMTSQGSFRNDIEGWIGIGMNVRAHVWINGTMLGAYGPGDPIFFLHYCNIDRLWALWQCQNPQKGYQPTAGGPAGHNLTDAMAPWSSSQSPVTCGSVWDFRDLGYSYDSMQQNFTADLVHTIRFGSNSWQPFLTNVEAMAGERGKFVDSDCEGLGCELVVCAATSTGNAYLTRRSTNPEQWNTFLHLQNGTTGAGNITRISCAAVKHNLHLCVINDAGKLLHTVRYGLQSPQSFFGDVEGQAGEIGFLVDVGCAGIGEDLHVCTVTADGLLMHTMLHNLTTWQSTFNDIEALTSDRGHITKVDCCNAGGELHVVCLNDQGEMYHTYRKVTGTWQSFLGDVMAHFSSNERFREVSCTSDGSRLHICAITMKGTPVHLIRYAQGWQSFIGNIANQVCSADRFQNISCGTTSQDVQVCMIPR